ncbi:glycoside hydrolase family 98 domain-containing protein, partial [uncultured Duncaniella sp.]
MKINHLFSTAVLLSALSVMFTGCDDKEFTAPVLKPEAVETPVDNINANIAAVRSFVQAKETGSKVRKTTVLPDDAGFMVEFSDGNTVSLRTKVGALADFPQQPDTYTPTVAAMPDEDGVYYWTIDGEWLTSATRAGEKINVTGAKAVTPRVSINENGDWVVDALDYGKTVLRPASRGEQISAISTVDISDPENVTVYFSDDTEPLQLAAGGGSTPPDVPITGSLRRPIDADHPAWFVHIDCWNYADPEKIISLIPEDVRPYCIFNLSLSVSHDESTGRFKVSEYGYELVKSWLRSCGEHNLWAMIQPSSGGYSHFPDVETYSQFDEEKYGMYKEFFTYPNFLGFNYCEQFWGFDSTDALYSPSWLQRVA